MRFSLICLCKGSIPHEVPQVLINREPLPHLNFDVELLGDCDVIVNELCHRLGGDFEQLCFNSSRLGEIREKPPAPSPRPAEPLPAESTSTRETNAAPSLTEVTRSADCQTAPCPETNDESNETSKRTSPSAETTDPSGVPSLRSEVTDSGLNTHSMMTTSPHADRPEAEEPEEHQRLEMSRRCWRRRICQSPISKRLGGKTFITYSRFTSTVSSGFFFKCCCCCFCFSLSVFVSNTQPLHFPRG